MTADLLGALDQVAGLAAEKAHHEAVTALYADIDRTQGLVSGVMDWLESVPVTKARKRESTHWRAGVAALKAAKRIADCAEVLARCQWGAPTLELEMQIARDGLWLATFDAGRACAWMYEAAARTAKGKVRSPETQARMNAMQEAIAEAAQRPGSAAGLAGKLQGPLARSQVHLDRQIRAARKRMAGSR